MAETGNITGGFKTEYPIHVDVFPKGSRETCDSRNDYGVRLTIAGTTLNLPYGISEERARELKRRIEDCLGIETRLKE